MLAIRQTSSMVPSIRAVNVQMESDSLLSLTRTSMPQVMLSFLMGASEASNSVLVLEMRLAWRVANMVSNLWPCFSPLVCTVSYMVVVEMRMM